MSDSKYNPKNILTHEPVAVSSAVIAVVNAAVLFGFGSVSAEQSAGLNIALIAVLGLLVRRAVTANPNVPE